MSDTIDPTLTVENVYLAMSMISDKGWRAVWTWGAMLQASMLDAVEAQLLSTEEAHRTCATLYIRYSPKASWQHLSRVLYQNEQDQALGVVKSYLPPKGTLLIVTDVVSVSYIVDDC